MSTASILFKKQSVHWLGLLSFKCQIFGWISGKVGFISSLKQDAQLHLQAGQMMTNAPIEHKRAEEFHFFKCCDHACGVSCVFTSKAEEHKMLF